jgi:hypothetical protein
VLPLSVPVVSSRFAQVIPSRCLISGSFALIIETLSLDASGAFRTTPFHAFVSGLHTVDVVVICRVPLREEGTALPSSFRLSIIALLGAPPADIGGPRILEAFPAGTPRLTLRGSPSSAYRSAPVPC